MRGYVTGRGQRSAGKNRTLSGCLEVRSSVNGLHGGEGLIDHGRLGLARGVVAEGVIAELAVGALFLRRDRSA